MPPKQLSQEMLDALLAERDAGYSLKGLNLKGKDLTGLKITSIEGSCFDNTTNFSRTDLRETDLSKMTKITDSATPTETATAVDAHLSAQGDLANAKQNAISGLGDSIFYDKNNWVVKINNAKSVAEVEAITSAANAEKSAARPTQASLDAVKDELQAIKDADIPNDFKEHVLTILKDGYTPFSIPNDGDINSVVDVSPQYAGQTLEESLENMLEMLRFRSNFYHDVYTNWRDSSSRVITSSDIQTVRDLLLYIMDLDGFSRAKLTHIIIDSYWNENLDDATIYEYELIDLTTGDHTWQPQNSRNQWRNTYSNYIHVTSMNRTINRENGGLSTSGYVYQDLYLITES